VADSEVPNVPTGAASTEPVARDAGGVADAAPGGAVEAALQSLSSLEQAPLAEHPDVYQSIHSTLRDALADLDGA